MIIRGMMISIAGHACIRSALRTLNSAVECLLYTEKVVGSNPSGSTRLNQFFGIVDMHGIACLFGWTGTMCRDSSAAEQRFRKPKVESSILFPGTRMKDEGWVMIDFTGLQIDGIYGQCPVQADGTIDGLPFYFRARGDKWSFSVAPVGIDPVVHADWFHHADYDEQGPFGAGWMSHDEARGFIQEAAILYRNRKIDSGDLESAPTEHI